MKKLSIKLLLSMLTFMAISSLYSMEEFGYTQPVREVYWAIADVVNARTPQQTTDSIAALKQKIAKLNPAETKLRDSFTGNTTIAEVIKSTRDTQPAALSPAIKQGLTEALQLLEQKPFSK